MSCEDNSNRYLRDVGYNVIRLPRAAFRPLDLLSSTGGGLQYIGGISKLLAQSNAPLPTVTADQPAANVNGNTSSSMNVSIGLNILNGLISALGGGKLDLNLGFTNARKATFQFTDVVFDSVAALDVGDYLRDGNFDVDNPLLKQILSDAALYVVTETLKSSEVTVKLEKSDGVSAKVDIPIIQNAVGGSVEVKADAAAENVVTFKGTQKLAFGFKCYRIRYKNGEVELAAVKAGGVVASVREEPDVQGVVFGGGLLDLG